MHHPRIDQLRLFAACQLDDTEVEQIESHLATCADCLEQVKQFERFDSDSLINNLNAVGQRESSDFSDLSFAQNDTLNGDSGSDSIPKLIGNYTILGVIGSGGMGTVYRGVNPHLRRHAAIKVVTPSRYLRGSAVERFKRELLASGKLQHKHIVVAFDGGLFEGRPYLVMELLNGTDLAKYVKDHGPFSVKEACEIIRQVALGLQYVHEAGLIHRDIKPSNLFRTNDETIKILDLGLARFLETEPIESTDKNVVASGKTSEGQIVGTPDYMSPEQAVDPAGVGFYSDIYSLGCTFFYLLTGKAPFSKTTEISEKIDAHVKLDLPSLKIFRSDVPPVIENLIRKMTAKKNEDRPKSAEVVAVLDQYLRPSWKRHIITIVTFRTIIGATFCRFWNPDRVTIQFFADYVEDYGVPQGIFPLTKKQVAQRGKHYRFESSRNKLQRVVHANSYGTPIESSERPAIQQLTYDDKNGHLIYIDQFDPQSIQTFRLIFSGAQRTTMDYERINSGGELVRAMGDQGRQTAGFENNINQSGIQRWKVTRDAKGNSRFNSAANSRIQRWKVTRDAKGRIVRVEFKQLKSNIPVSNTDGVFGHEYTLDHLGRVINVRYLGVENQPHTTQIGIAGRDFEYDGPNLKRTIYVDVNGQPTLNEELWACIEELFDNHGNVIISRFCAPYGQLTYSKEHVAEYRYEYDEHGNCISGSFFDIHGTSCVCTDGFSSFKAKYDLSGNLIWEAFFGNDGKPCIVADGFASRGIKYDSKNNPIERTYFGIDGEPCCHILGHARISMRYDAQGNLTEQIYFDPEGNKCSINHGVATFRAKHDELGNMTSASYYGVDDQPTVHSQGFASFTAKYDEHGNAIEQHYFDVAGNPVACCEGYAVIITKYNDAGNMTDEAYLGIDGQPCLNIDGHSSFITIYDKQGNIVRQASFGIDGKPCIRKEGISSYIAKYDGRGNRIEETYFDSDQQPCVREDGYSTVKFVYDDHRRRVSESFFGPDGLACLRINGIINGMASIHYEYDEQGNTIEEAYYGIDEKPILCIYGYAGWTAKYDTRRNTTSITFFGIDRTPCSNTRGIASSTFRYNERNEVIATMMYDLEGNQLKNRPTIMSVATDSPAAHLGIFVGDVLLEYNGVSLDSLEKFDLLRSQDTEDAAEKTLSVSRNGQMLTFRVKPGLLGVGIGNTAVPITPEEKEESDVP